MTKGAHKLWHQLFHRDEQRIDWRVRSHAEYKPEPEPVFGGTRLQAWADGQLRAMGFNPALVRRPAPGTQRQTGGITPIPPTPRDTPGEIPAQELARRAAWSDVDTVQDLRRKREWLYGQVPGGVSQPMPVLRNGAERTGPLSTAALPPEIAAQLPKMRPLTVNDAPLDEMLATMRQDSRPLPPFLGFTTDTSVVPDLPTAPRKPGDFDEDPWINGALPPTELQPLDVQALASADQVAVSRPVIDVTEEDCAPVEDNQPTLLHERTIRARSDKNFQQALSGLREKKGDE